MTAEEKGELLFGPVGFQGRIVRGDLDVPVCFTAAVERTGQLRLDLAAIPFGPVSRRLLAEWQDADSFAEFRLEGGSDEGDRFASETFYITSLSHRPGEILIRRGRCRLAEIVRQLPESGSRRIVQYFLRGFKCVGGHTALSPLGTVGISGSPSIDDPDELTGCLQIISDGLSAHAVPWQSEVEALLRRVLLVVSFASGTFMQSPIVQLYQEREMIIRLQSTVSGAKSFLEPFSSLNLGPIFTRAVETAVEMPQRIDELRLAVEWMLTPATYSEVRLTAAMTALEHIVGSHLSRGDKALMDRAQFRGLAAELQSVARARVSDKRLLEQLLPKLQQLNQRSLRGRIERLLETWEVPMAGLPEGAVPGIVEARNKVLHRGRYYDEDAPEQIDLWTHVVTAREILTRIVLRRVGFVGHYFTYVGGCRQMRFPGCDPV